MDQSGISQQSQTLNLEKTNSVHQKKYGNLCVISNSFIHLSIGPDYPYTIAAFAYVLSISYGIYSFESNINFQTVGKIIMYIFASISPISLAMTVFSDPGIYDISKNIQSKTKFCDFCELPRPQSVKHCDICNTCVYKYDHHCPWMSKCIGHGNLWKFYLFIVSIPMTFMYFCFLLFYFMNYIQHK